MKIHSMGRFKIEVPIELKLDIQTNSLRRTELKEFLWPGDMRDEGARRQIWNERVAEINKRDAPEGIKKVVIDSKEIEGIGKWSSGVYYYGNRASKRDGYWDVLLDSGPTGVWLKYHGLLDAKDEMLCWVLEIARAYRPGQANLSLGDNQFHLLHGSIDLPYKRQEQTYARFEGHPLNLKLEIEMQETHHVAQAGLIERLGAVIATNYAPRVDVKKIRSHRRTVAGLKGEDVIIRTKDRYNTVLCFAWEYPGEVNSGERPEIQITMESPDGALEEKIKVWDAILDSFKPM